MPKSLSVKNVPNLCRKLAHRYMQAFYTDWVYKVFWHFLKMYPICVECLHIGICKHSTQIGYIRLTPIPFLHKLGTFSKMCPICVECLRILKNICIHGTVTRTCTLNVKYNIFLCPEESYQRKHHSLREGLLALNNGYKWGVHKVRLPPVDIIQALESEAVCFF